jgi:tetratricopeptide (TPR) repeat protein
MKAPELALALALLFVPQAGESSAYRQAVAAADSALAAGDTAKAREAIVRALERDKKSREAWALRARLAEKESKPDERIYSLHQEYRLAVAQRAAPGELESLRKRLLELDPLSKELLGMSQAFVQRLAALAQRYEKDGRPHAAIGVLKTILALEPENLESAAGIERIAARPDPSLAGDAKPKDLFAGVSTEWIREQDAQHATWENRAKLERPNYVTTTDAGYEVLVRAGEAMEQMNAFYREFFRYGTPEDKKNVTRIELHIFRTRDEYLKLGQGPPADWSGGQFTGAAVETYMGAGGFDEMTGTLFHEAAHQFVSLATQAVGWLNEGLASFFEGTRMLANGTVIMNLPANHRLFPLAERMEKGWMASFSDGTDPKDPNKTSDKAPTFRIVLENKYSWGPPWYAPTWGVVYFLYNYQDPLDGRFVYRAAFQEFIDKSGGRVGEGAIENFEEVVLAHPAPPLKLGGPKQDAPKPLALPKTCAELDLVWKEWMLQLRDEQQGKLEVARPYREWGRVAALNGDVATAKEHFEKGLVATPEDPDLLLEFADLLAGPLKNPDRASKLVLEAIRLQEERIAATGKPPGPADRATLGAAERVLDKLDPSRDSLTKLNEEMGATARSIVQRYEAAQLPMMVMDVSWRLGTILGRADLFEFYERGVRTSGQSLRIWDLAYNEQDLKGWNSPGADSAFKPDGIFLNARFGEYDEKGFDYQMLTLDQVTSGDFSMQADVQAVKGKVNFCGFAFGRKGASSFHGVLLFPGKTVAAGIAEAAFLDLTAFYGSGSFKNWLHTPVDMKPPADGTSAGAWHTLRVDVSGRIVDLWFDGELMGWHEYPSLDVLRGSFGLVCGRGEARFKNVRYAARDPRDPAGRIERDLKLKALESSPAGAAQKSLQGRVPPWLILSRWAQGERHAWEENGAVPQLLVLFSIQQNDAVRIDQWLADLAQRTQEYGLEFVCVCSVNDDTAIGAYLKSHPFPGAVAVDFRDPKTPGIGETFQQFSIRHFNLPRILLLDLDQTVAWEGDPGFMAGIAWKPGEPSFLDSPLQELFEKRKVKEVAAWNAAWKATGKPALLRGELEPALELLKGAKALDSRFAPEAALAQQWFAALEAAVEPLAPTAKALQKAEAEPALPLLVEWRATLGFPKSVKTYEQIKPLMEGRAVKDWEAAEHLLVRYANRSKKGDVEAERDDLLAGLAKLKGRFPRELAADLRAAREKSDTDAFNALVDAGPGRPRAWLAREYLGWRE